MVLAGLLAIILAACAEEPLPERKVTHGDCLREVDLEKLEEAIERCSKVVEAFPGDPLPLSERFLLHSLAGNNDAACRDISRAAELAGQQPSKDVDPLLRKQLDLRLESCRD